MRFPRLLRLDRNPGNDTLWISVWYHFCIALETSMNRCSNLLERYQFVLVLVLTWVLVGNTSPHGFCAVWGPTSYDGHYAFEIRRWPSLSVLTLHLTHPGKAGTNFIHPVPIETEPLVTIIGGHCVFSDDRKWFWVVYIAFRCALEGEEHQSFLLGHILRYILKHSNIPVLWRTIAESALSFFSKSSSQPGGPQHRRTCGRLVYILQSNSSISVFPPFLVYLR